MEIICCYGDYELRHQRQTTFLIGFLILLEPAGVMPGYPPRMPFIDCGVMPSYPPRMPFIDCGVMPSYPPRMPFIDCLFSSSLSHDTTIHWRQSYGNTIYVITDISKT